MFDDGRNDVLDTNGNPTDDNIYGQRLNSSGVAQWSANGIPLTIAPGNQYISSTTSDGAGGIVATWIDIPGNRNFSQKISVDGISAWAVNGVAVSPSSSRYAAVVTADGLGNYIYSFVSASAPLEVVTAQKLNENGILQWAANGIPVSNNTFNSFSYPLIVTLSDNGAVIVGWSDGRNSFTTGYDIYASKLLSNGLLAGSTTSNGYTSTANGNWNSPSTWGGGVVPPATAQVTVKHTVTITANTTCQSLRVEQPAGNVIVKTGTILTVTN